MTTEPDTMTGPEVAKLLGIDESLIRKWKHRRKLVPAGLIPGRGRGGMVPLYRVADVRPLADTHKAQQVARD